MKLSRALVLTVSLPVLTAWSSYEETSRVTGAKVVNINQRSTEVLTYGSWLKYHPVLIIECKAGVPVLAIEFGRVMDSRGQSIDYKIDDSPAHRLRMHPTTSFTQFLIQGTAAVQFGQSLIGRNMLHVRATPYNDLPIEVSFELAGLEDAIKPVADQCKWDTHLRAAKAETAFRAEARKYWRPFVQCVNAAYRTYPYKADSCYDSVPPHLRARFKHTPLNPDYY